jgi:hypothetical protein
MKIKETTYFGIANAASQVSVTDNVGFFDTRSLSRALMEQYRLKKQKLNPMNIRIREIEE